MWFCLVFFFCTHEHELQVAVARHSANDFSITFFSNIWMKKFAWINSEDWLLIYMILSGALRRIFQVKMNRIWNVLVDKRMEFTYRREYWRGKLMLSNVIVILIHDVGKEHTDWPRTKFDQWKKRLMWEVHILDTSQPLSLSFSHMLADKKVQSTLVPILLLGDAAHLTSENSSLNGSQIDGWRGKFLRPGKIFSKPIEFHVIQSLRYVSTSIVFTFWDALSLES